MKRGSRFRFHLWCGIFCVTWNLLCAQTKQELAPIKSIISASIIHGTVDVVISTTQGFAFATDSRATQGLGPTATHTDDAQKLFPVGDRAACVIAGLIGSELGGSGFQLRDAIGTSLRQEDRVARSTPVPMTAAVVADSFRYGLERVTGLLPLRNYPGLAAQVSAVSISPDGSALWIGADLPLVGQTTGNQIRMSVGSPIYHVHGAYVGLRFDLDVLGQPQIIAGLLGAKRSTTDRHTQTAIMRRYYSLKGDGQLDRFTLREAISLARALVQATIDLAPPDAGVGGSFDVATLTRDGFHWVQKKPTFADLPSPHSRVFDSRFAGAPQNLDNLECVRCDFTDSKLFYAGTADVELVDNTFGGSCRLALAPDAEQRRPDVVRKLKDLMHGACRIVIQSSNYP